MDGELAARDDGGASASQVSADPPDAMTERGSETKREREEEGLCGGGRDNAQSTPARRPGITGEVFPVKVESRDHYSSSRNAIEWAKNQVRARLIRIGG